MLSMLSYWIIFWERITWFWLSLLLAFFGKALKEKVEKGLARKTVLYQDGIFNWIRKLLKQIRGGARNLLLIWFVTLKGNWNNKGLYTAGVNGLCGTEEFERKQGGGQSTTEYFFLFTRILLGILEVFKCCYALFDVKFGWSWLFFNIPLFSAWKVLRFFLLSFIVILKPVFTITCVNYCKFWLFKPCNVPVNLLFYQSLLRLLVIS